MPVSEGKIFPVMFGFGSVLFVIMYSCSERDLGSLLVLIIFQAKFLTSFPIFVLKQPCPGHDLFPHVEFKILTLPAASLKIGR